MKTFGNRSLMYIRMPQGNLVSDPPLQRRISDFDIFRYFQRWKIVYFKFYSRISIIEIIASLYTDIMAKRRIRVNKMIKFQQFHVSRIFINDLRYHSVFNNTIIPGYEYTLFPTLIHPRDRGSRGVNIHRLFRA